MSSPSINLFPAIVKTPTETYDKVRLVVHEGRARVFGISAGRPALLAAADVGLEISWTAPGVRPKAQVLTTADGERWELRRGSGCGCSHPLKNANLVSLLGLDA